MVLLARSRTQALEAKLDAAPLLSYFVAGPGYLFAEGEPCTQAQPCHVLGIESGLCPIVHVVPRKGEAGSCSGRVDAILLMKSLLVYIGYSRSSY